MSRRISAHGISVEVPGGWDAAITRSLAVSADADEADGGSVMPVLHVATFPLPSVRGDFGGDFLTRMGPDDIFMALVEYDRASVDSPLFERHGVREINATGFSRQDMHRPLPGQSGHQQFFNESGRAFCLYVAIGSHRRRAALAGAADTVASSLRLDGS